MSNGWVYRKKKCMLRSMKRAAKSVAGPHGKPDASHARHEHPGPSHVQPHGAGPFCIDFGAWGEYLGDPPLAMALTDRVVDGAIILKIVGKSYRAHRAQTMKPQSSTGD